MQYTENYSLRKPQMAETASVSDLNYNSDRIDAILADDRQISVAMYVSGNTYNTGDLVGYENPSTHHIRVYRCLVDNVTGVWDSTKWTLTNLADEILDAKASGGTEVEANPTGTPSDTLNTVEIDNVIYAVGGDSANQNIADAFSELQTYAVGDYCIYESILYKCTTAVQTAGAWDSTKWTPCVVTDEMGSGGGGGSSTFAGLSDVSLTSLTDGDFPQYDATAQKWKNVAITGVSVQPVIYSMEEREIGVWTNGKPLYQRSIELTQVSFGSWRTYSVGSTIEIVNAEGALFRTNRTADFFNYYEDSTAGLYLIQRTDNLAYKIGSSYSSGFEKVIFTIQYTKTTDVAGSGTWTPSGVPSVNYSTDEQVVGTWIDGATLYEKTVRSTVTPSESTWTTIPLDLPTGAQIIKYEAYYRRSTGAVDLIPQYNPTGSSEWLFGSISPTGFTYKVGSPYIQDFSETNVIIRYTKSSS